MGAWIIFGLLLVSAGSPRPNQERKANENTEKREEVPLPSLVAPATSSPDSNPHPPTHQTSAQNKAREYVKKAFAPEYFSNWVLVAVGAGGIFVGLKSLCYIRRQTGTMRGQLVTMRAQSTAMGTVFYRKWMPHIGIEIPGLGNGYWEQDPQKNYET